MRKHTERGSSEAFTHPTDDDQEQLHPTGPPSGPIDISSISEWMTATIPAAVVGNFAYRLLEGFGVRVARSFRAKLRAERKLDERAADALSESLYRQACASVILQ